jgi:hypothetical protein
MRAGWWLGIVASVSGAAMVSVAACSSVGGGGADAGADAVDVVVRHPVDGGGDDSSGGDGGCAPADLPVDASFPFVPPNPPRSVCTVSQIQALYDDCWGDGGASACTAFNGDPTNAPCIDCMITPSSASTWGAIVTFPNGSVVPNSGGCIAVIGAAEDGGSAEGGAEACGAEVQSAALCQEESCALLCPGASTAAGLAEFQQCEEQAATSTCETEVQAAFCASDLADTVCVFPTFEGYFVGLGEFFCASSESGG